MKKTKQIMSMLLAVFMMVMTVVPVMAEETLGAVPTEEFKSNQLNTEKPKRTTVNIFKLKADRYKENEPRLHTGSKISKITDLGTNVKPLAGVRFTVYKMNGSGADGAYTDDDYKKLDDMIKNRASYATSDQVKEVKKAGNNNYFEIVNATTENKLDTSPDANNQTKATSDQGLTSVELEEGIYWIIETDKPETVSSSIAVPFGISLPLTNQIKVEKFEIGTAYLKEVHVYPKNIEAQFPEIDKDVKEIGNKNDSSKVGDIVPWIINVTVPTNIKDYKEYKITDKLDNALDFVQGSIKVYYEKPIDITGATPFEGKSEISIGVAKKYEENSRTITVEFSENKGIPELAKSVEEGKKVYVYFETKINDKAVMGQPIPNNAKITFKNRPDSDGKTKVIPGPKRPKTVTGGKKFVKVDFSNNDTKLKDAEFVVINKLNNKDKILTKDNSSTYVWKPYDKNSIPEDAVKLTSAEITGAFEIKGLEYSEWKKQTWDANSSTLVDRATITNNYRLVEVKAPEGYALIEDKENNGLNFTVDADSYKDQTGVLEVKNKKITIPQTGGIGTIIFTVAGIALMAGAAFALKKNAKED